MDRLAQQIQFVVEIDKLKQVVRRARLMDDSRYENDAEHSWHQAAMAMVLAEHANDAQVDRFRVMRMLVIHDLVEIDAGDTFAYDVTGHLDKAEREQKAADRLFGMLPPDQAQELRGLWDEFEERVTPEARFAAALDRFQPLLHNYHTQGHTWKKFGITAEMVLSRNASIAEGSEALWAYARRLIEESVEKGYLPEGKPAAAGN
ncbi:HD domain-containing protein [Paenibacillus sp. CC-CFT747]|nr:HD domain-containing protein [Paenibacillus sp. CC-CFT747]